MSQGGNRNYTHDRIGLKNITAFENWNCIDGSLSLVSDLTIETKTRTVDFIEALLVHLGCFVGKRTFGGSFTEARKESPSTQISGRLRAPPIKSEGWSSDLIEVTPLVESEGTSANFVKVGSFVESKGGSSDLIEISSFVESKRRSSDLIEVSSLVESERRPVDFVKVLPFIETEWRPIYFVEGSFLSLSKSISEKESSPSNKNKKTTWQISKGNIKCSFVSLEVQVRIRLKADLTKIY